jgi:hypothetical protein
LAKRSYCELTVSRAEVLWGDLLPPSSLTEEEEMETDARSSLGQSASETEEDTVSISKKEVCDGVSL